MVRKISQAFSWAGPLWPTNSRGPLAGLAHYDTKNLVGLLLGWPLWTAKSCGPLVGPAHLNFMGHFWAGPRVNVS